MFGEKINTFWASVSKNNQAGLQKDTSMIITEVNTPNSTTQQLPCSKSEQDCDEKYASSNPKSQSHAAWMLQLT